MKTDNSWAYALQPGDKAAIRESSPYGAPYVLVEFSRATATQFIFNEGKHNEKRVNKADMTVRGGNVYRKVEQCTDFVKAAINRYEMIREIEGWKAAELSKLSVQCLSDIVAAYHAGHPEIAK